MNRIRGDCCLNNNHHLRTCYKTIDHWNTGITVHIFTKLTIAHPLLTQYRIASVCQKQGECPGDLIKSSSPSSLL